MKKNNLQEKTNPYADANGSPIKGQEKLFFEWAEKEWGTHLETLEPEEQKEAKEAVRHMSKKMNS